LAKCAKAQARLKFRQSKVILAKTIIINLTPTYTKNMKPYIDTYQDEQGNQRFSLMDLTEDDLNFFCELTLKFTAEKNQILQNCTIKQTIHTAELIRKINSEKEFGEKFLLAFTGTIYQKRTA
jgi:hypothetical protein